MLQLVIFVSHINCLVMSQLLNADFKDEVSFWSAKSHWRPHVHEHTRSQQPRPQCVAAAADNPNGVHSK